MNLAKGNIMTHWKINISMYGSTLYIFYSKFSTHMLCVDNSEYYLRFQFQIKKWHFESAYWQEIKPEGQTLRKNML